MMRWLLTYADMITLLLALFIILFSISTINKVKLQRLVHDLGGGFNSRRDQQSAQRDDGLGDQRPAAGDAATAPVVHHLEPDSEASPNAHPARGEEARAGHLAADRQAALRQRQSRPQARDQTHPGSSVQAVADARRTRSAWRDIPTTFRFRPTSSRATGNYRRRVRRRRPLSRRGRRPRTAPHLALGYGEYRPKAPNDTERTGPAEPPRRRRRFCDTDQATTPQDPCRGSRRPCRRTPEPMSMLSQEEIDALVNQLSSPDADQSSLEGRRSSRSTSASTSASRSSSPTSSRRCARCTTTSPAC